MATYRTVASLFLVVLTLCSCCCFAWVTTTTTTKKSSRHTFTKQHKTITPGPSEYLGYRCSTFRRGVEPAHDGDVWTGSSVGASTTPKDSGDIPFDTLMDMDVVVYSVQKNTEKPEYRIGAIQENGSLVPLSTWTTEYAFRDSMEFLVDEKDRGSMPDTTNVKIHYLVPESQLSYGSRQIARGVHNPHGEESELLYYVDHKVIREYDVKFELKPNLEIMW